MEQRNRKVYQKAYMATMYQDRREKLSAIKNVPCMDCGKTFPFYVMDFDHRPGETKLFSIGESLLNKSWELILAEIAKCDVVCANCHRERTFRHGDT